MERDAIGDQAYWNQWIDFDVKAINIRRISASEPVKNPSYEPQFVRDLAFMHLKLLLRRYSRGDSIDEFPPMFLSLLECWEESMRLASGVWTAEQQQKRHTWSINLEHYMDSFWLVGLAHSFDVPDDQWRRLLALIGNEGQDELLDRIIATRQTDRRIGRSLCYPKPYAKLLATVDAAPARQAKMLCGFVEHWYVDLKGAVRAGREKQGYPIRGPYWYTYHQPMKGAYFGYWCIEAVAAVKAFALDDSLCIGHPHYPGDLLRPGSATPADAARLPPTLVASLNAPPPPPVGVPEQISNWEAFKRVVANKLRP